MNVLELFAGSRSMCRTAESLGYDTFSTDYEPYPGIDCVCDIMDFDIGVIPFKPDIIWASPPCTAFSVASIGHHWNPDKTPKTAGAIHGMTLLMRTIEIIRDLSPVLWYIENPRGMMRTLEVMRQLPLRHTVTYCQYGETRMKPTDIWTNNTAWSPRPACKNGAPCHERAPRGSQSGTQAIKGAHQRAIIPPELCHEVLTQLPGKYIDRQKLF